MGIEDQLTKKEFFEYTLNVLELEDFDIEYMPGMVVDYPDMIPNFGVYERLCDRRYSQHIDSIYVASKKFRRNFNPGIQGKVTRRRGRDGVIHKVVSGFSREEMERFEDNRLSKEDYYGPFLDELEKSYIEQNLVGFSENLETILKRIKYA